LEALNRRHARRGDGNAPSNSGKAMAGAWMRPRWAIFARDVAPYCHRRGRPTIRANYAEALRKHGFEVTAYAARAEALAAMSARLPDLALIDIGLGADIDGASRCAASCAPGRPRCRSSSSPRATATLTLSRACAWAPTTI